MTDNKLMRKVSLLSLTISGILALSCTSRDDFQQPKVMDSVFSVDALTFDPLGETFTLTYSADENWRINYPSEWLEVSPSSGNPGTYEITVSARINNSWAQRTGSLIVDEHQISVTQDCPYLRLTYSIPEEETLNVSEVPVTTVDRTVGDATFDFAWNHSIAAGRSPFPVKVESNIDWEMVLDEGFEDTYFQVDGKKEGTIAYHGDKAFDLRSLKSNFNKEDYQTRLTIRPVPQGDHPRQEMEQVVATYNLQLTQDHLLFLINGEADDVRVDFDELGYAIRDDGVSSFESLLRVQCEIPWEVEMLHADSTHFENSYVASSVPGGEGGSGTEEIRLEIPKRYNPEEQEREMIVRLSAAGGDAFRDIHVYQSPYIFEIDPSGVANTVFNNTEFSEDGSTAHDILLRTTGSWSVSVPSPGSSWLVIDPSTTRGNSTPGVPTTYRIRFWSKTQNLHLINQALANLRFSAVNGLVKPIQIKQEPFQLKVDCDTDQLANISSTRTSERFPMRITASNAWKLLNEDRSQLPSNEWYYVSSTFWPGATEGRVVNVGAAQVNDSDTKSRTKVIILTSDIHEAMSSSERSANGYAPVKITLVQRPFTFRVNGKTSGQLNTMVIPAYKKSFADAIRIESDGNWQIAECPSWIHPSSTYGTSDTNLALNPDINLDTQSRSAGTVKVNCLWEGSIRSSINVSVSQDGVVFKVSRQDNQSTTGISPAVNYESYNPLSYGFSVQATDELPWVLETTNYSFIASENNRSGSGNVTIRPTYNPNLNAGRESDVSITLDRSVDPRIASSYVEAYRNAYKWHFSQNKYEFDSSTPTTVVFRSQSSVKSGSKDVSFKCSGPWTVSSSPSWVHVDVDSGSSNPKFALTADNNPYLTRRGTEYVIVRSLIGSYEKRIPVEQDQYYYGLTSSSSLTFETVNAKEKKITFRSSGPWTLDNANGWGASAVYGNGDDTGKEITVTLNPPDYLKLETDHQATVTLHSGSYSTETVRLSQPKYVFDIGKTSVNFDSPFRAQCADQSVDVNCTGDWKATSDQDWVKVNNGSKTGNGTFSLSISQDNLTINQRNATITVVSTYKGTQVSTQSIQVAQSAYVFSVTPTTVEFEKSGGTQTVNIDASGDWEVTLLKDDDSMLDGFSTVKGSKKGVVTIKAKENPGRNAKAKTATLQVKCQNSNNLVQTITLKQKN